MSSIYTTAHTSPPYTTLNVDTNINNPHTKMFANRNMLSSYNKEDVSDEFVRQLIVYTNAMLIGDIKNISSEYLFAAKAAFETLHHTRRPIRPDWIERMWSDATSEEGHLAENFANKLRDHIIKA